MYIDHQVITPNHQADLGKAWIKIRSRPIWVRTLQV